jgi:hypothetical protein
MLQAKSEKILHLSSPIRVDTSQLTALASAGVPGMGYQLLSTVTLMMVEMIQPW